MGIIVSSQIFYQHFIMDIKTRAYKDSDLLEMTTIWNEIVDEGNAFPQMEELDACAAKDFFASQSYCGVAVDENGKLVGLYILHPNNVGRCGHLCNASFAVAKKLRGCGIGRILVEDCIIQAKNLGFRIMQFNAVVKSNHGARHLYEKLGFTQLGVITGGFLRKDGIYEDICPYYKSL